MNSRNDAMKFEERLNQVADKYRSLGYQVVIRPGANDLPAFAKDFQVEIVAVRDGEGILVSAKASAQQLEADANLSRYAEVTGAQPGWRFDLFVLGPDRPPVAENRAAKELSEAEIRRSCADIERLLQAGFVDQALLAAWAVLESAMRRKLRAEGEEAGWGTSPRTMLGELYSSGAISTSVLRDLEQLIQLRNAIAHGFAASGVDPSAVRRLVETASRLLDESQLAKQPA